MKQGFKIKEKLRIETYNADGSIAEYRETYQPDKISHRIKKALGFDKCLADDIILDSGLADIVRMIAERYQYVSVGTGTTTPEHDDEGLEAECMDRSAAATSILTTFFDDDTVEFRASFTPLANYTIAESAIHVGASGDVPTLARETFVPMAVTSGKAFSVSWVIILMR